MFKKWGRAEKWGWEARWRQTGAKREANWSGGKPRSERGGGSEGGSPGTARWFTVGIYWDIMECDGTNLWELRIGKPCEHVLDVGSAGSEARVLFEPLGGVYPPPGTHHPGALVPLGGGGCLGE